MFKRVLALAFTVFVAFAGESNRFILVDCGGVFAKSNKLKAMQVIGIHNLFKAAGLKFWKVPRARQIFFRCLDRVSFNKSFDFEEIKFSEFPSMHARIMHDLCSDDNGVKLPPIFIDLLLGYVTAQEVQQALYNLDLSLHKDIDSNDKAIALQVCKTILPENMCLHMIVDKKMVQLIQKLKNSGYKIIMVSNFEPGAFAKLKEANPEAFSLFDEIVISGDLHRIKPSFSIFEYVFRTFNIQKESCLFIDDQKENYENAIFNGLESILHKNADETEKQLISLGYLSS